MIIRDKRFWFCVLLVLFFGLLSGFSTIDAVGYYQDLVKPFFAPPSWLFGPVWTILYILMGISLFYIITHHNIKQKKIMLALFMAQFFCNLLWTTLFFTFHLMVLSVIDMIALWILLAILWIYSIKHCFINAILFIPYFLWISFAMALNIAVWQLNG